MLLPSSEYAKEYWGGGVLGAEHGARGLKGWGGIALFTLDVDEEVRVIMGSGGFP